MPKLPTVPAVPPVPSVAPPCTLSPGAPCPAPRALRPGFLSPNAALAVPNAALAATNTGTHPAFSLPMPGSRPRTKCPQLNHQARSYLRMQHSTPAPAAFGVTTELPCSQSSGGRAAVVESVNTSKSHEIKWIQTHHPPVEKNPRRFTTLEWP